MYKLMYQFWLSFTKYTCSIHVHVFYYTCTYIRTLSRSQINNFLVLHLLHTLTTPPHTLATPPHTWLVCDVDLGHPNIRALGPLAKLTPSFIKLPTILTPLGITEGEIQNNYGQSKKHTPPTSAHEWHGWTIGQLYFTSNPINSRNFCGFNKINTKIYWKISYFQFFYNKLWTFYPMDHGQTLFLTKIIHRVFEII